MKTDKIELYNLKWNATVQPIAIEMYMIQHGGRWRKKNGEWAGEGLFHHFKQLQTLLWPTEKWHPWRELLLKSYCENGIIGVMAPAATGKTYSAALFALSMYYCFSSSITILVSSTELKMLRLRVWGEIIRHHKLAKQRFDWLPGQVSESAMMIVTDKRFESEDGRDFRNGIVGIPCLLPGTKIDTPTGYKLIEKVKVGDTVLNAAGSGKVTKVHFRYAPEAIRIILKDGRRIDCTPDHPIFTQRGWIKAIDLSSLDMVYSGHETLRILRENYNKFTNKQEILQHTLSNLSSSKNLRSMRKIIPPLAVKSGSFLLSNMCKPLVDKSHKAAVPIEKKMFSLRKNYVGNSCEPKILLKRMQGTTNEISMPMVWKNIHINQRISREIQDEILFSILQKECNLQQCFQNWKEYNSTGNDSTQYVSEIFSSPRSYNRKEKSKGNSSTLLRTGHSLPGFEIGSGNRWWHSSIENGKRYETITYPSKTRVDHIEVLKPTSGNGFNKSKGGYPVYNIEVDGHPSYSANGVIVHNCKRGGTYVGLGSYIGIHNKIVMLIGDECQLMPAVYVDAISNLSKCPKFICIAMGNPIGIDNGLGKVCEPSSIVGGWDGGIDQTGGTKTWPTRFKDGICVQLVGTDSPNFSVPRGTPYPFPTLLKPEDIEKDVAFYGTDSWNYLAMDEGRMPRGIGVRRVITRQLCLKNGAMEEPLWRNEQRTRIGALDAAYSATGGDRSVFVELDFGAGFDLDGKDVQLIFIRDIVVVPVTNDEDETPEDQIANRVMEECIQRGITPENFFFDSTGKGTLMASFARLWSNMVNPVEFGGKASERQVSNEINQISREYYFNFVSELWYSMRYVIEAKQLRGMTEEALSEFIGREWGYQNRRIQVEPKEKMKLKLGRSPDIADAIVTALEGARRRGFVISKLSKQRVYNADDGQWKRDLEDLEVKLHHECDLNYSV